MAASTSATALQEAGYRVDDLIVDIGRQRITRNGVEIPLSQLSFELLVALARAAPNLLSFDQLMERVWPGLVVSPETVSQRVKLVRDALGDDPHSPRYILGVRGRGYRMLAEVSQHTFASLTQATAAAASRATATVEPAPLQSATLPLESAPPLPASTPPRRLSGRQLCLIVGAALLGALAWAIEYYSVSLHRFAAAPAERAENSVVVEEPKTIAVLPLVDISPGGSNQYLGDGLAQELSSRLGRIPGIRVASQTSVNAFKGRPLDVRTIASQLGVQHVLEGSVRRDGDHLRVTAQLIDAGSGYRIWAQTYDHEWKDLLLIEDDLSRSIIQVLQVVLSHEVAERVGRQPTAHLKAFDLYLAGLAKLQQPADAGQLDAAEGMFQQALAIDPGFALGYAGLCECHTLRYDRDRDVQVATKAEQACNRALALDSSLHEVDVALAHLYRVSGRDEQAAAIYRKAIARNPGDADAYIGLAESYAGQRLIAAAETAYRRAIDAEPDYRDSETAYANFLLLQGRAAASIPHYRRVTELAPESAPAFSNLGAALEMSGDLEAAARAFEKSLELEPTSSAYSNSGTVYYFQGRFADAAQMFRNASALAGADHRLWGNLADALYQIHAERDSATRAYRHAIALAERGLAVNPNDAVSLIQLAYYYSRVGDGDHAKLYAQRARRAGPDVVYVHYYGALIALQQHETATALDELQRALDLGFPVQLVRAAPDFAALRGDARFEQLVSAPARSPNG
jgi:TolB-like protein/tetratricopeptide (TPR) repeat protein/DNA-binding winged helix-turn-helix (wHTH) protein